MEHEYLTIHEHKEFAARMDEENHRQNERLRILEGTVQQIQDLTISVRELATSVKSMSTEIEKQGQRLERIEEKPGKRWESLVTELVKVLVAAVVGFALAKVF